MGKKIEKEVFIKEQEARRLGAYIPHRQNISALRNKQKDFIDYQNAARRDEFIRQQDVTIDKQTMQEKIDKYDAIMRGESNKVSDQYLVNFESKGLDVTMEDHGSALLTARRQRNEQRKHTIDFSSQIEENRRRK